MSKNGVQVKLYSGNLSGLTSPVQNYVPLIVADITLEAGTTTVQQIPANYNTFLYVIEGSVRIGEKEQQLSQEQVGWLDISGSATLSDLIVKGGEQPARFIIYAGKPTGENIMSYGPFIADSSDDIKRLYQEYREGKMKHISTVPQDQRILHFLVP